MPEISNQTGTVAPNENISFTKSSDMSTISSVDFGGRPLIIVSEVDNIITCLIPPTIALAWGSPFTLTASDGVNIASMPGLTLRPRSGWDYISFDGNAPSHDTTESFHELAFNDMGLMLSIGDQIQYSDCPEMTVDNSGCVNIDPATDCSGTWAVFDISSSFRFPERSFIVFDPSLRNVTTPIAPGETFSFTLPASSTATTVTLGGQALTILTQEDQVVTCEVPADIPLPWGSEVTLETSDGVNTLSLSGLTLSPRPGWGFINFDGTAPSHETSESFHELAFQDLGVSLDVDDQIHYSNYPRLTLDNSGVPNVSPAGDFEGQWNIFDNSANTLLGEQTYLIVRPNLTPNFFTFNTAINIPINTQVVSNAITIQGIENNVPMRIEGGEYSVNGGAYVSSFRYASAGDIVTVRGQSSSGYSTESLVRLIVGEYTGTFSITTTSDATPDPFTFADYNNAQLDTLITSAPATISGTEIASPIEVTNGEYSINDEEFTSTPGTVLSGQRVRVRVRSANSITTPATAEVTIGGIVGTFTVTTEGADILPDGLRFENLTDVALSTTSTSSPVTVTGINVTTPISITGGEYSVNGGTFTATPGTVEPNDSVAIRVVSSNSYNVATTAILTVGLVNTAFSATTITFDQVPTFLVGQLYVFPFDPLADQSMLTLFAGSNMQFYLHNLRRGNSENTVSDAQVMLEIRDDADALVIPALRLVNISGQGDYAVTIPHDAPFDETQEYTVTVVADSMGSHGRWISNLRIRERISDTSRRLVLTPQ